MFISKRDHKNKMVNDISKFYKDCFPHQVFYRKTVSQSGTLRCEIWATEILRIFSSQSSEDMRCEIISQEKIKIYFNGFLHTDHIIIDLNKEIIDQDYETVSSIYWFIFTR